ncbi:hypothetical protein AVEN_156861-1 [Araneus ventricosus]|uniref:Uncharacterized protein n=1 Tax=Araneus ventricosus TaxID=182803 RepID=A0A4Y2Q2U1_ARAVE|nr:hypothetical protein AVEN_156861-1 [Araneus ventricosus]
MFWLNPNSTERASGACAAHPIPYTTFSLLAPLNPGGFRRKRHEFESSKLGGHLPLQTLISTQNKPTASDRPSSLLRGNFSPPRTASLGVRGLNLYRLSVLPMV